jgi:hypothetical protein
MTYEYSDRGLLARIGGAYGELMHATEVDAEGHVLNADYGGILKATYSFDATTRQLATYDLLRPKGDVLMAETYGYDLAGDLTRIAATIQTHPPLATAIFLGVPPPC